MNFNAKPVARPRVTPYNRIMPDDATRRVVESSQHGKPRAAAHIHGRNELANFVGVNHATVDAQHLIVFSANAKSRDRRVGMSKSQMAALAEEEIPSQFPGQALIAPHLLLVER